MAGIISSYSAFLARRPFVGNMVSSAVLFAAGDVIAQQAVEKKGLDNHDYKRTGRAVVWGSLIFAPAVTVWFRALDRIPIKNKIQLTAARVALDQLVAAPIVLSGYFTAMTFLEGKDFAAAKKKWKEQFWPTLTVNWMLFVPFQAVNMSIIPLHYRLLAINCVNIPWNAFLSLQNAKAQKAIVSPTKIELAKMA